MKSLKQLIIKPKTQTTDKIILDLQNLLSQIETYTTIKSKHGQQNAIQKPWYLIIGLDDSGKQSLIQHSELTIEKEIGGKDRHFKATITQEAIFIQTPGYLLERSKYMPTWLKIIDVFTQFRPKQFIDGMILAISTKQLVELDKVSYEQFALQLHSLLNQLAHQVEYPLPIYFILTFLDQIKGFKEYFGRLSYEEKSHPFGFTIEPQTDLQTFKNSLHQHFHKLSKRLNDRVISRIEQTQDAETVLNIQSFPSQIEYLCKLVQELFELCLTQHIQKICQFRGLFFTSIYQGNPSIDCLSQSSFSNGGELPEPTQNAHFSRNIFQRVIPNDQIYRQKRQDAHIKVVNRNQRVFWHGLYGLIGLSLFFFFKLVYDDVTHLNQLQNNLQYISVELSSNEHDQQNLNQWIPILNSLNQVREYQKSLHFPNWMPGIFSHAKRIQHQVTHLHKIAIKKMVLPHIKLALENKIQTDIDKHDTKKLYHHLYAYLMLNHDHLFNRTYFSLAARNALDLSLDQKNHTTFIQILNNAIDETPGLAIENTVVKNAQKRLAELKPSEMAYEKFKAMHAPSIVFSSSTEVHTFYQQHGYPKLYKAAEHFVHTYQISDDQVLGHKTQFSTKLPPHSQLLSELLTHHSHETHQFWVAYFKSHLPNINTSNMTQAYTSLNADKAFSSAEKAQQHILSQSEPLKATSHIASAHQSMIGGKLKALAEDFKHFNQTTKQSFEQIRLYFEEITKHSDPHLYAFNHVKKHFTHQHHFDGFSALFDGEKSAPKVLSHWLKHHAEKLWQLNIELAKKHIEQHWTQDVMPFYEHYIQDRYPVKKFAEFDINIHKFDEFFGAKGTILSFIKHYITPFYDTHQKTWAAKKVFGVSLEIPEGFQKQLIRGQIIHAMFYEKNKLAVNFKLKAHSRPANEGKMKTTMFINGHAVRYDDPNQHSSTIHWPGPESEQYLQVLTHNEEGQQTMFMQDGPWAWFKLLDQNKCEPLGHSRRYLADLKVNHQHMQYEIIAQKPINPFIKGVLEQFQLPKTLIS